MQGNYHVETITIGSIRYYHGFMPTAVLVNDEGKEVGYLRPYRGYRFQVYATFDKPSDPVHTTIVGLNSLLNATFGAEQLTCSKKEMDDYKAYVVEMMAMAAINMFCNKTNQTAKSYGVEIVRVFNDTETATPYLGDGRMLPVGTERTMLRRFVALCIKGLSMELYMSYTADANNMDIETAADIKYYMDRIDDYTAYIADCRRCIEENKADVAATAINQHTTKLDYYEGCVAQNHRIIEALEADLAEIKAMNATANIIPTESSQKS